MRKMAVSILVLLLFVSFNSVSRSFAQDRSLEWVKWNTYITDLDPVDNSFDVTEEYLIDFNGTFRFGTAVIPANRLESISNLSVTVDGVQLENSFSGCARDQPGTFCFQRQSNEYALNYYFPRTITDAILAIQIKYTVLGALRVYEGGDQLWWDAIPEEHFGFPIREANVIINIPSSVNVRPDDPVVTYGARGDVEITDTRIVARAVNGVGGNEMFSVRMQYEHIDNARQAAWQAGFDATRNFEETVAPLLNVLICGVSLLIGGGIPLFVFVRWRSRGRDPQVGPVPEYLSEPPSALPAGLVGSLLDEKADMRDILATLIDLARRGYIVIEEEKNESAFGLIQNSEFTFKRTDKPDTDLRSYEKRLIKGIFTGSKMERTLASLRNKFYTVIPQLQTDLYKEMVKEDLFAVNPNETRGRWGCGGVGLFIVGVFGFFMVAAVVESLALIMAIPIAFIIAGVATILFSNAMPAKTHKGALEAAKWNAFRQYLSNLDKYTDIENVVSRFDEFLPYTIAFGLDRLWMQRFRRVKNAAMPPWYSPVYLGGPYRRYTPGTPFRPVMGESGGLPGDIARAGGSGSGLDDLSGGLSRGLESLSTGLTTMLNSASSVMTSAPQSSGGRSGGGFSGGGFSGGGGSGGGSRGFG